MAINTGRVLVGGLVAGLIINIGEAILNAWLLRAQLEETLKLRNLPPIGGAAIGFFVVLCFVLGIVLIWLYAAMRPRLGAGPKTAVIAAIVVWFLAYFWSGAGMAAMGFMPLSLAVIGLVWGLAELVIAAIAGAKLYHEPTPV